MKTIKEILNILEQLDERIADEFEGQDLDFKEWISNNADEKKIIKPQ